MTQTALDSLQKASDLDVGGWNLKLNSLVILVLGREVLAVLVVDVRGYLLSQAVPMFTELLMVAMNFVRVVAVCTLAGVHLEVVKCPALSVGYWAGERLDWILHEPHRSPLLRRNRLGVDDCRHGGS